MRHSPPTLLLALIAVWTLAEPVGHAGGQAGRARLEGVWRWAGRRAEVVRVHRAIDEVVDTMSTLVQGIVRRRLVERNQPYREVRIAIDRDRIRTWIDGTELASPADGSPIETTSPTGRAVQMSQRLDGDRLVQLLSGQRGTRHNELTVDASGRRIRLSVRIESPHLPEDIHYRLTYERGS